ncbi:hypothetical protein J2808_004452 [Pseudarthrobacter sulfonivorans]|nr:hypothetical protein [Pseudarthrobacter sulfonivorans]
MQLRNIGVIGYALVFPVTAALLAILSTSSCQTLTLGIKGPFNSPALRAVLFRPTWDSYFRDPSTIMGVWTTAASDLGL